MQKYQVTIFQSDKTTKVAKKTRKGSCSPDALQASLLKEDARWKGVLYAEDDLDSGLEGDDFKLPEGNYILVLTKIGTVEHSKQRLQSFNEI